MSLFVICKIFRLFANTLTPDDKYFLCNSPNLSQPIQIQLSKKKKGFSQLFAQFLKSASNFEQFEKITSLIGYLLPKLQTLKNLVRPMSKQPRYTTPFDSHSVKDFYTLANCARQHLYHIFIHSGENWVWKCLCS